MDDDQLLELAETALMAAVETVERLPVGGPTEAHVCHVLSIADQFAAWLTVRSYITESS